MDIKSVIKAKGFTMEAVAGQLGISRVTLSQNISRNPTVATLQKIADVIGCKIGDFFLDDVSEHSPVLTCPVCGSPLHLTAEPMNGV